MIAADYIVKALEAAGIRDAFTVVGGGSIFLCDALRRAESMRYVACHHEQAATMAAEGYARARPGFHGLAIVTSGPGGTNAVTGVAGAWLDHVPTITISGQVFSGQTIYGRPGMRQVGVQEINIIDIVRPITKYAVQVRDPQLMRYELEAALWTAQEGRPGPVWLDIPADVQKAEIFPARMIGFYPPNIARPNLTPQARQVVELLQSSKRPLLHVGQGVRIAGAVELLQAMQWDAGIPMLTARNGNDLVASDDPLYVGRPGTFAQRAANFAVQTCDLYIAIGTRLSLAQTGYNARDYARNAKIVMVDIDESELKKGTVRVDFPICADAGEFIQAMREEIVMAGGLPSWQKWLSRIREWQRDYPVVVDEYRYQADYVNSYHFADVLSDLLSADDLILTDMGFAFQTTHQAFRVKAGQRFFTNCGLAAMGWGLPAAIGAAVGTGRRTICIAGDGGLMMNVQELSTLAHHDLPVKLFVLNNGGYLTMRQSQENAFDGYMGSDEESGIKFPDFEAVAAAHGIRYASIMNHAELVKTASEVLGSNGPVLCEIFMDPAQEALKSVNKRDAEGNIIQTAIEDAYPYLDPAEVARNLRIEP